MASLLLALLPAPAYAHPTPKPPKPCTNQQQPPPAVGGSETPDGVAAPLPLPVPSQPLGGERMGECRLVLPADAPRLPKKLTAASWMLTDLDTGAVLAAKDPHGRHRPASLIKVLLALVVIEELDPELIVTASKLDAGQECTCIGIVRGQRYSVHDLFTSLLIRSGNDVAHALGSALGGTEEALRKMNDLARRLGALDTRAATTSGLDGPGMTSSAYDMSLLFRHAMRQPRFAEAVLVREMRFKTRERKPPITIYNDNRLLREYTGFLGGKTGFTGDARHTYVGSAERGGKRLSVVLLRGEQRPIRVSEQAIRLLDYGFKLAKLGTEPVGRLVEPVAEPAEPVDDADDGAPPASEQAAAGQAASEQAAAEDSDALPNEFGILIILAALLGGAILLRRKSTRP